MATEKTDKKALKSESDKVSVRMGVVAITRATKQIAEMIKSKKSFSMSFCEKDGTTHTVEHLSIPVEYYIDGSGKKWRRVYD